jgi:hypothetical protein
VGYYLECNKLKIKLTIVVPLFGGKKIIFGNINLIFFQDNHKMEKIKLTKG